MCLAQRNISYPLPCFLGRSGRLTSPGWVAQVRHVSAGNPQLLNPALLQPWAAQPWAARRWLPRDGVSRKLKLHKQVLASLLHGSREHARGILAATGKATKVGRLWQARNSCHIGSGLVAATLQKQPQQGPAHRRPGLCCLSLSTPDPRYPSLLLTTVGLLRVGANAELESCRETR